jgi:tetratricopeptide (TPR) repeat protein
MKNLLLLLAAFLCLNQGLSQSNVDSLRSIWENESEQDSVRFAALQTYYFDYSYSLPDSSITLTDYHVQLAKEKNSSKELANALNEKALAFFVKNEIDSAVRYINQILEIHVKSNDSVGLARSHANLGSMYREHSKYQEAIISYSMSMTFLNGIKGKDAFRADLLNNIGLVYEDIRMSELALDYLNQALTLYTKEGLDEKIGNIWLNIGAVEFDLGNTDKALDYIKKANQILTKTNNQWSLASGYHELATVFWKTGRSDSAFYYVEKGLAISEEMGNQKRVLHNLSLKANLLLESNITQAIAIGEDLLKSGLTISDKALMVEVNQMLYKAYKEQGRAAHSLQKLEQFQLYSDSLTEEENQITVVREAIKREFELKLLNNQLESEKVQAKLELNQVKRIFVIILVCIFLILAILFYYQRRINFHRNQKAQLLEELEKLKSTGESMAPLGSNGFQLNREKIDQKIDRKLNETDWNVLNILLNDPVISNKEIAEQAFMSTDGIGSSLRRMYLSFDIKESKYKKISLLLEAIKISNNNT